MWSILSRRLLLALLAALALSLGALLVTETHLARIRHGLEEQAWARLENLANRAAANQLRSFDMARFFGAFAHLRSSLFDRNDHVGGALLDEELVRLLDGNNNGFSNISLLDARGFVIWSTARDAIGLDLSDRPYVNGHFGTHPTPRLFGPPRIGMRTGRLIVSVSRAIRNDDGSLHRITLVTIDALELSRVFARIEPGPAILITSRYLSDGQLRAANMQPEVRIAEGPDTAHPVVVAARTDPIGRIRYQRRPGGEPAMAAYRSVPEVGVVVAVAEDVNEVQQYERLAVLARLVSGSLTLAFFAIAFGWERTERLRQVEIVLAGRDPLTGLLNRRAVDDALTALLPRQRDPVQAPLDGRSGESLCLLLVDLDHFKAVNDRFGHSAGDAVLRRIARALQASVRQTDLVSRWGGEEFLVVLRHCEMDDGVRSAEAIRESIAALPGEAGGAGPITVSVGVAAIPRHGKTFAAALMAADAALYRAKAAGRDRVASP